MKIRIHILVCVVLLGFNRISYSQSDVTVKDGKNPSTIEISNGLLGIVVPKEGKPAKDFLAPIQSFIFSDGKYSDNTENYLQSPTPPVSMTVKFQKSTKDEVTVVIGYSFQKKKFEFSTYKFARAEAGPGYYNCTITIKKGEKAILIEEDANYDIGYSVKVTGGLSPDKARYRGWSSISTQYGYEPSGVVYRPEHTRGFPLDATVDLDYSKPLQYPKLTLWDVAGGEINTGRYWMIYNSNPKSSDQLIGFFQGAPGRLVGGRAAGPNLEIKPVDNGNQEKNDAEIHVSIDRLGADVVWYPRKRFQWGVFISTQKDLLSPEKTQPIALEMNKNSGLGNKIPDYLSKPAKLIPAFYKAAIYMPEGKVANLIKAVKNDNAVYQKLCNLDGGYKPLWDAWHNQDSAKSLVRAILRWGDYLKVQYTEGEGTYARELRYWTGVANFKYYALAVSGLFADNSINISPKDKASLEQIVALMARIVWDDNNVPLFDSSGINLGPANMSYQYRNNGRFFFALLFANDPEFSKRSKDIAAAAQDDVEKSIYASGASFGSPHYTQATMDPILFTALQLKQSGVVNLFKANPKLTRFANFYMSLLTPESPRFLNLRKMVSFGDGTEENSATFALLSTGLADIDSSLSKRLMTVYLQGMPRASIFGPISLAMDLSSTQTSKFKTATSNYTGYLSHFRSDLNTPNETAIWVLNGDSLFDHRNDDAGEMSIYALGAPLSVSRSSFYYPQATDSRIRSVVVPEKLFPQWNASGQPISERSITNRTWPQSQQLEFCALGKSASTMVLMKNQGKEWYRKISMITLPSRLPIIVIYDSCSGKDPNIWSLLSMSEGAVNTPAGAITPVKTVNNNGDLSQLPQASPVAHLSGGLNRFAFNGQSWAKHPSKGIDWDLYTLSNQNSDFTLAQWGTTWQNTSEINEFFQANQKKYSEDQQILRIRSTEPFFAVLLPYNKGTRPYSDKIKKQGEEIFVIKPGKDNIYVSPDYYKAELDNRTIYGLLSAKGKISEVGITVSGGQTELEFAGDSLMVRVQGNAGDRQIRIPGKFNPAKKNKSLQSSSDKGNTTITISYAPVNLNLSPAEQGYQEFIFIKGHD